MYHKHQTEGIILKGYDSGDSSRKVALLSKDLGLIYAHVQNGRGLKSKLRGSVQEFSLGRFVLVKGVNGWKLVGGEIEQSAYQLLKREPTKLKVFANVLNLIRSIIGESMPMDNIFNSLREFALCLSVLSVEETKLAEYAVLLKFLHELGYLSTEPALRNIVDDFSLKKEKLVFLASHQKLAIYAINRALHAAQVRM
jgi:DNA repair protein RecO